MRVIAFPPGANQAAMDGRVVLRPAVAEPFLQLPESRHVDEDVQRRRSSLADLERPFDLDFEDDILPSTEALDDRLDRGPVEVPGELGEFEEGATIAHVDEVVVADEVV